MISERASSAHRIDLQASTAALQRAAALARQTAIATNTCLVVVENGQIVRIPAETLRQQAQAVPPSPH